MQIHLMSGSESNSLYKYPTFQRTYVALLSGDLSVEHLALSHTAELNGVQRQRYRWAVVRVYCHQLHCENNFKNIKQAMASGMFVACVLGLVSGHPDQLECGTDATTRLIPGRNMIMLGDVTPPAQGVTPVTIKLSTGKCSQSRILHAYMATGCKEDHE